MRSTGMLRLPREFRSALLGDATHKPPKKPRRAGQFLVQDRTAGRDCPASEPDGLSGVFSGETVWARARAGKKQSGVLITAPRFFTSEPRFSPDQVRLLPR